ncbi:hypothetical protein NCAS_0D04290 [Naumovozyma castellii]|uniref:Spindle pole body-associated protein Vik1/Cik1 microtubule binding domain-containing protein n=1 Tax=Naumovozyma castellii TaxID=27288 RepID=G0VEL9_NAUCA|nr:hypothetical protein NCAS_0D04290 [Naumovozyma castellii CBS 4309]CCC70010.1 hypothetical protein NCAS_0D04290 [Naumovozyma castellii CBS 4309]
MHNNSRIPSLSSLPPVNKKPKLSSPIPMSTTLKDVTNKMIGIPTESMTTPTYNNKLTYGNDDLMETFKKRERKLMKGINYLKNGIIEIEKEIIRCQDFEIPDTYDQIDGKVHDINLLKETLSHLITSLDAKENEIDASMKNEEMIICNLQMKFSIGVQELENELNQVLYDEDMKWERELNEVERMKPAQDLQLEMDELNLQLNDAMKEFHSITKENEHKCALFSNELEEEFEKFKNDKNKPMLDLRHQQEKLRINEETLTKQSMALESDIADNEEHIESLENEISKVEKLITETNKLNITLRHNVTTFSHKYNRECDITKKVEDKASILGITFNEQNQKMIFEKITRRKLENTIDERRGSVRCFAYIDKETLPSSYRINYTDRRISNIHTNESFFLNKIIEKQNCTIEEFFHNELRVYQDMCLTKNMDFTLITISKNELWRSNLISFISSTYLAHYHVDMQHVFIEDNEWVTVHDMIKPMDTNLPNIRYDRSEIQLGTNSFSLEQEQEQEPRLITEQPFTSNGVHLLKLKFIQRSNGRSINFYYVQLSGEGLPKRLQKVMSTSPTDLLDELLQFLTGKTKSCFLLDIEKESDYGPYLDLSSRMFQGDHSRKQPTIDA